MIPTPATLTSPGVTIGSIALTCYDELALIRYCVDFQGYYRSGYRTKFWVSARKGLRTVVGKDVEDVEKRMRVLLAKRRAEKRILEEKGILRVDLVKPEYRELLDMWDDRVRYVESGEEKVRSHEAGMEDGESEGVQSPVKVNTDVPTLTTPNSSTGWIIESPAQDTNAGEEPPPVQPSGDKPHRTRLKPAEEVILLRLCVQHKDLYKTLFKATFWKFIQKKLQDETSKHFTNPEGRIRVLLKRREIERKELKERGRLTIDLVDRRYKQWLDKWQEWLDEVGVLKRRRTRDANEIRTAEEIFSNTASSDSHADISATLDAFMQDTKDASNSTSSNSHSNDTTTGQDPTYADLTKAIEELRSRPHNQQEAINLIVNLQAKQVQDLKVNRDRLDQVAGVVSALVKEREEMKRLIERLRASNGGEGDGGNV